MTESTPPALSELVPFEYEGRPVRTVIDLDGQAWFVAADVCAVLEMPNVSQAMTRLDQDERTLISNEGRPINVVNEAGLYSLILGSRKPQARIFKRWVTHEVLPSIRRTGSYAVPVAPAAPALPQSYAEALRALADEAEARELADRRVAELEPAAEQYHRWQDSPATVYVVEWAKTLGLTQAEGYEALRACDVLFKQRADGGSAAFNVPKREYERYFVLVDEWLAGPRRWTKVPKITAEGQVVLAELMVERGWVAP